MNWLSSSVLPGRNTLLEYTPGYPELEAAGGAVGSQPNLMWGSPEVMGVSKAMPTTGTDLSPEERLAAAAAPTEEEVRRSWISQGLTRGGKASQAIADWATADQAYRDEQNKSAVAMAQNALQAIPSMWNLNDTMRMRTGGLSAMAGGR